MLGRIEALPEQCAEAWRRAAEFELPARFAGAREVVVIGMGGSAIAGDILRAIAAAPGRKAVHIVRGYEAPSFVGEETLVVACSHRGNTEETLSAFQQALEAGARPDGRQSGRALVVTTGGRLEEMAKERGVPAFVYEYDGEPRSAIGHQLMALLALGERVGLVERQEGAVAETVALMRKQRDRLGFAVPSHGNPAKQLAGRLFGRLPVVVGGGVLTEAAHRWKTQLNENSKCWALYEELPELGHNAIAGFGLPRDVVARLHVVFLWHGALHPRLRLRYDATAAALDEAGVSHERVEARGESPLAQVLSAVYLGDLVSYYLALLNGVEPTPVVAIDRLKAKLAKS
jgi:glucose/mannose-6-phosphate isomerase